MEMYELCNDYETNVHKRQADTMNHKFVQEFMAYSPLYDPDVPQEANKISPWEGHSGPKNDEISLKEVREKYLV